MLVRGQDREFNIRLKKAGGKILFVPDIVCHYYARANIGSYAPWIYFAGLTPFFVTRLIRKRVFSWRNLVPLGFVLSLLILSLLSLSHPVFLWLLLAEIIVYLASAVVASFSVVKKERDARFIISMPFIFAFTHITYGLGSMLGLFKSIKNAGEWTRV